MVRTKLLIVIVSTLFAIAACGSTKQERYSIASSKTPEASLFRQNCAICHGPEGEGKSADGGRVIPNIRDGEHRFKTADQIYNHIANGGNGMVPFRDMLTKREIDMLVNFVLNDLRKEGK